jgi:glutathione S-transferase
MKLFGSTRSPYVRKVLVSAYELGLSEQLTLVPKIVSLVEREPEVCAVNPLGQIPTLILTDGQALFDSFVICDYLDAIAAQPHLIPVDRRARVEMGRRHAEAEGLMLSFMRWYSERRRTDEPLSERYVEVCRDKFTRLVDQWERQAEDWQARPIDLGFIATGCALAYADFRFEAENWRTMRPQLTKWYTQIAQRPSFLATVFRNS